MGFLDIWTIITGAASIISLLIAMSNRFPSWRKYVGPSGLLLAGFTIGRISIGAMPGVKESVQDPRLMGILMIMGLMFVMLYIFLRAMISRNQDAYAYFVVFMVLVIGVPQIMDKYFEAFPTMPKEDYLILANSKEKNNDIAGAIRYLEKYKAMTSDEVLERQTQETIVRLQKTQLDKMGRQ
jgi:hypothetical protein